ncbi:MAG: hypothetical protein LUD16_10735 [Lachnospiraceae bacterium]|nr:hypothetical protein [Lachnospiraceae bacterium]
MSKEMENLTEKRDEAKVPDTAKAQDTAKTQEIADEELGEVAGGKLAASDPDRCMF